METLLIVPHGSRSIRVPLPVISTTDIIARGAYQGMRRSKSPTLVKRYTGRTSKFNNFASMDSSTCGCCGEALLGQ
jgi:hypothetical protein